MLTRIFYALVLLVTTAFLMSCSTRNIDKKSQDINKNGSMPVAVSEPKSIQKRLALLIGNAAYPSSLKLNNPVNDVRMLAPQLKAQGFDVTLIENIKTKRDWLDKLNDFGKRIDSDSLVLFYYAGHGFQYQKKDYLRPLEAEFATDSDVEYNAIELKRVLFKLLDFKPAGLIAMIDACRENFMLSGTMSRFRSASVNRGMAQKNYRSHVPLLQFYSTSEGGLADDGQGQRNSPFALALAETLQQSGLSLDSVLNRISARVPQLAVKSDQGETQIPVTKKIGYFPEVCLSGECDKSDVALKVSKSLPTGTIRKDSLTGSEFVWIEPKCFYMRKRIPIEDRSNQIVKKTTKRVYNICLKKGFWLSKTEVTVAQYKQFVMATGYKPEVHKGCFGNISAYDDSHPAVCVSWNDVQVYIAWLNRQTQKQYRLPTEGEWEFAARAGKTRDTYWEDDDRACLYANVADKTHVEGQNFPCDDNYQYTAPVGRYRANNWGLQDMLGNVWEWTCSRYNDNYQSEMEECSSKTDINALRVLRGGSWREGPSSVDLLTWAHTRASNSSNYFGFRLVHE